MAHRPSAFKSLRQDKKRRLRNQMVKSRLRTEETRLNHLIERGDVPAAEAQLNALTKLLQRAGDRRIIHRNRASRVQAQCQHRLNAARAKPAK